MMPCLPVQAKLAAPMALAEMNMVKMAALTIQMARTEGTRTLTVAATTAMATLVHHSKTAEAIQMMGAWQVLSKEVTQMDPILITAALAATCLALTPTLTTGLTLAMGPVMNLVATMPKNVAEASHSMAYWTAELYPLGGLTGIRVRTSTKAARPVRSWTQRLANARMTLATSSSRIVRRGSTGTSVCRNVSHSLVTKVMRHARLVRTGIRNSRTV